jgi:hypothetical protein
MEFNVHAHTQGMDWSGKQRALDGIILIKIIYTRIQNEIYVFCFYSYISIKYYCEKVQKDELSTIY